MANRVGAVYSGFSILAFFALCAWSIHAFTLARANNVLQATNRFTALTQGVAAIRTRGDAFNSAAFEGFMRSMFLQDPSLESLVIRSAVGEVEYVIARHPADVEGVSATADNWNGRIRYNSSVQRVFTAQIPLPPETPPLSARAVMTVLDRASIYPIIREIVVALIGFIIFTAIVIALSSLTSRGKRAGKPGARPAGNRPDPGAAAKSSGEADRFRREAGAAEASTPASPPEKPTFSHLERPTAGQGAVPGSKGSFASPPRAATVETVTVEEEAPPHTVTRPSLEKALGEPVEEVLLTAVAPDREHNAANSGRRSLEGRQEASEKPPGRAETAPGGESLPNEGPRVETIRAEMPDIEVTELEPDSAAEGGSARSAVRSATEELEDLPEIEDLEEIDGHRSADTIKSVDEIEALAPSAPQKREVVEEPEEVEPVQELEPELLAADDTKLPDSAPVEAAAPVAAATPASASDHNSTVGTSGPVGLFNPETGLAWGEHLEQRLTFELERSASFDQDLVLAIIRCRELVADRQMLQKLAAQLLAYFPFRDLCFERPPGGFSVIIPNTEIDQAIRTMEAFQKKVADAAPSLPHFQVGLTARNGRLLSGARMIREAESAAARAEADRKNTIFALRVDPGKYREYIKSTLK